MAYTPLLREREIQEEKIHAEYLRSLRRKRKSLGIKAVEIEMFYGNYIHVHHEYCRENPNEYYFIGEICETKKKFFGLYQTEKKFFAFYEKCTGNLKLFAYSEDAGISWVLRNRKGQIIISRCGENERTVNFLKRAYLQLMEKCEEENVKKIMESYKDLL